MTSDDATRMTDMDAILSRLSAIQKGYIEDPYTELFVGRLSRSQQVPRPPVINRGTHIRTYAIDNVINQFLSSTSRAQIISLGSGSDTRFWRYSGDDRIFKYIEVDFDELTSRKIMHIRKSDVLSSKLDEDVVIEAGGSRLLSNRYKLLPTDLRTADLNALINPHVNHDIPTLVLCECVLVYMPQDASNRILRWLGQSFNDVLVLVYEMTGIDDKFGQTMLRNLKARGVELPGVSTYDKDKYIEAGLTKSDTRDLEYIRNTLVSTKEKERISKLEILDEIEELSLILQHYSISWGMKSINNTINVHL
ncbi:hypothetical protein E3P92_03731 [Wallemia ichthyophaga]|uniref:Leucine carboxyl methyltransferase 1 n=2 Tax=Wallemia ichthyophaga TaxID=245174 RepID=A0A4T0GZU0_WALIC|nr:hypothetical protein E3P91_04043 [Wallemia ichthyophaga]TIA78082.1 hypothetical protein E3P98_03983 [Wallemia ichthyophaga]TIA95494.1 hypothetical protein E3P95_03675 [Wallemia ichthyophaga]TIA96446.1 hypothetical protein E3P94_03684 [Wallemia ichthyophaga]TIB01943.1 hypothetical protein E3P96_02257 [Wallemia ichthyophaga]